MDPTRKMLALMNFASSAYLTPYTSSSVEKSGPSIKKKGLRGKDWNKRKNARKQAKKSKKKN